MVGGVSWIGPVSGPGAARKVVAGNKYIDARSDYHSGFRDPLVRWGRLIQPLRGSANSKPVLGSCHPFSPFKPLLQNPARCDFRIVVATVLQSSTGIPLERGRPMAAH